MSTDTPALTPAEPDGIAKEVLEALKKCPGQTLPEICSRVERARLKVQGALDVLVNDGWAHMVKLPGVAARWSAGPKPAAESKKPEKTTAPEEIVNELVGEVNAFITRSTTLADLVKHGEEQLSKGVAPAVADWEDNGEGYLAAAALHQTIVSTPNGERFLALPRPHPVIGRDYVPVLKTELEMMFWRDIKLPKRFWTSREIVVDSEGKPIREDNGKAIEGKRKTFEQIMKELSVPAKRWLFDGLTKYSYVDADGVFHRACWALEDVDAKEDPDCDAYLRTWGPENYDRLCDWIVHTQNLSQPAPMLVLHGHKGDGKDLLLSAIASQYRRTGGVVDGAIVTDHFNADLAECPIVGSSEKLPENWKGQAMDSGTFRKTLTREYHDMNDKNAKRVKLYGTLRWCLTTNEPNFFPTKEVLSQESQEAVLARMLVISSPKLNKDQTAPQAWLKERMGWEFTHDWVDKAPFRMTRHVRFIMKTHKIKYPCPEGRFGVASFVGSFRDTLAVNTTLSRLILEGLLRFLLAEPGKKKLIGAVRLDRGKVLVQIGDLHKHWTTLTASGDGAHQSDGANVRRLVPAVQTFADEISNRLSTHDDEVIDGRTFKRVRVELLRTLAEMIGEAPRLEEALKMTPEEFAAKWGAVKAPGIFGGK